MRRVLLAVTTVMALAASAAGAGPLDDAKSGLAALEKGDSASAIGLFTRALDSGQLGRADQELAHVKRAQAYLHSGDARSALADANQALDIDPRDQEATAALGRARDLLNSAPEASSRAPSAHDAALAKYEAQKKIEADRYSQQVAAYEATIKSQEAAHEAEMAAWRADVQACKEGDKAKCGRAAQGLSGHAEAPSGSKSVFGNTIFATLNAARPSRMKFIAADSAWDCTGVFCVATDAPDTAKGVAGCAELTSKVGQIAAYVTEARALDWGELARCNAQMSTASR
ncbi:MAG TPA: hypothetical protein VIC25_01600 [Caulobacteraceae bacterium]